MSIHSRTEPRGSKRALESGAACLAAIGGASSALYSVAADAGVRHADLLVSMRGSCWKGAGGKPFTQQPARGTRVAAIIEPLPTARMSCSATHVGLTVHCYTSYFEQRGAAVRLDESGRRPRIQSRWARPEE